MRFSVAGTGAALCWNLWCVGVAAKQTTGGTEVAGTAVERYGDILRKLQQLQDSCTDLEVEEAFVLLAAFDECKCDSLDITTETGSIECFVHAGDGSKSRATITFNGPDDYAFKVVRVFRDGGTFEVGQEFVDDTLASCSVMVNDCTCTCDVGECPGISLPNVQSVSCPGRKPVDACDVAADFGAVLVAASDGSNQCSSNGGTISSSAFLGMITTMVVAVVAIHNEIF